MNTHRQPDRLETLGEISRVVSATLDLNVLYETIYQQIGRLMDTSQFFIALHHPGRQTIEIPYLREEGKLYVNQELPYGNSVTSLVIERGTPLLFHTDEEYARYAQDNGLPEITVGDAASEGKIYVPLSTGRRTIGALTVQSTRRHGYTEDDVRTLSIIASQAAVAITNARLYARSQDSVREMHALLNVARMVSGSLDLQTVLDSILVGMRDVMPFAYGTILLPDYSRRQLDIVGAIGTRTEGIRKSVRIPFAQGVTGKVFETGEPLIVPNVRMFPGYVSASDIAMGSEMAVPLKRGESVIGVLNVEREEIDSFVPQDLDLLSLFASQAAIAIENARLYAEQQQRVTELATIQRIVQQLNPLHEVPAIASVIERELRSLIDYHACRLFVLDPLAGTLHPITTGTDPHPITLRVGEGIAGWIAEQGEAVMIPNTLKDDRVVHIVGTPIREESILGVPLVYEGRVRGVITLSRLGIAQFDQNALRLLQIIAAQAAIAFDRARLYAELRTDAITDPVTTLYNRRYLLERSKEERSRALRNRHELAAIMIDIDKFKRVNDRWGHDAGDVVLQHLGGVIRAVVRAEDIVARYGGEEFCILLPEIPVEEAEGVAERLRETIAADPLPETAGEQHITVSVGVAFLEQTDEGEAELFTRADHAMYQVKHVGGNRVCVAEGERFRFLGDHRRLFIGAVRPVPHISDDSYDSVPA